MAWKTPIKSVLLVEDDEDEIHFMERACASAGIPHKLNVVKDGSAAIDYFSGTFPYNDRSTYPLPAITFLDIKLPKRTGHEVLAWVRTQKETKHLPVIMLTGSNEIQDVQKAYDKGANSYFLKTASATELHEKIETALKYWLTINVAYGDP